MRRRPAAGSAVGPVLARLAEQSLVQAVAGRFRLLETLRTYAAERLADDELPGCGPGMPATSRIGSPSCSGSSSPRPRRSASPQLAAMTADLHAAWDHAAEHDRPLAVELAAVIYDFAYQRQRLDLLDWGLQVADWDLDHPDLSQALATAAAGAWAAGELETAEKLALRGISSDRSKYVRAAPGRCRRPATSRCSPETSTRRSAVRGMRGAEPREERPLAALMAEVSVCQAMTYAGRAGRGAGLVDRAASSSPGDRQPERHRLGVLRDR